MTTEPVATPSSSIAAGDDLRQRRPPGLLFTAFEPSGDDHAAAVILELRRRHPDLPIYGWGGPKMRRAGAVIIAETGKDAVMGLPGLGKILEHRQINRDIAEWLDVHPEVRVHIPVDSPAANFPVCAISKKRDRQVVHLVAPQLWAWGQWRVKKLRRLSDLVLCILPFEQTFFADRGVNARFIGHPLFDEPLDTDALTAQAADLPQGRTRLALLPGSRPAELRRNFPVMLSAYKQLRAEHPDLVGVLAATTESVREQLYAQANATGGWPDGLDVVVGQTDLAIRWCDLAVVVSGTVTLQVAKQAKPMAILYKVNKIQYRIFGRLVQAPYLSLPNLVAGREIVPELMPYFAGPERLLRCLRSMLNDPTDQEAMRLALRAVTEKFAGKRASAEAADAIEQLAGIMPNPALLPSTSRTSTTPIQTASGTELPSDLDDTAPM